MSIKSLYNPGFLGESFNWWIGQIAADYTWRDNILPGKYENKDQTPGWGYRYKVRIIGLHDQGETAIPSENLPWAQVMYPVTGGGGQANAGATPNLRQGMFVFGFFLDGQDQQVPVIMGVLGNNSVTELSSIIGDNSVTNSQPGSLAKSGYASPVNGTSDTKKVPDEGLPIKDPQGKFPTKESVDGVHQQTKADIVLNEHYNIKISLLSPCETVNSALKSIQNALQTLSDDIDKILQSARDYVDAVSSLLSSIESLISNVACVIAKYMKLVFDKIKQYVLSKINSLLAPTVNSLPLYLRHTYYDIKYNIVENINCLYSNITNNLCSYIKSLLDEKVSAQLPKEITENNRVLTPITEICSVENLVGEIISLNIEEMNTGMSNVISGVGDFLNEIQGLVGDVSSFIDYPTSLLDQLQGSITTALSFENISLTVFGCDLKPSCPASDYYTIQNGSGSLENSQQPRPSQIQKETENSNKTKEPQNGSPYAQPSRNQNFFSNTLESIRNANQFISNI